MNVLKSSIYAVLAVLLFASCKASISTIPVPKGGRCCIQYAS